MIAESSKERGARIAQEAVDEDEPFFVIRAKDDFSPTAILAYRDVTLGEVSPEFTQALDELMIEFHEWRTRNPDKVKLPDLRS